MSKKASKPKTTSSGKPRLRWTAEMDLALVGAVKANPSHSAESLTATLRADSAFEGVAGILSPTKVTSHMAALRRAGVNLPKLPRGVRSAGVEVDALNELLTA